MPGHCAEGRWITMESARINDAWRTASANTPQGGSRPFNFGAGPGALPQAVLAQAAEEMQDWRGCGMGVMEMSHRGRDFMTIYEEAVAGLRRLLAVPPEFHILFQQGGGIGQNAMVPLNLGAGGAADFVLTGSWSEKSHIEAGKYLERAGVAASGRAGTAGFPQRRAGSLTRRRPMCRYAAMKPYKGCSSTSCPIWRRSDRVRRWWWIVRPTSRRAPWTGAVWAWPSPVRRKTSGLPA